MNRRDEPATDYDALSDEDKGFDCEHPNATTEMLEYEKSSWWADAHMYVNDDSETLPTTVCPDCGFEELQEPEEADDYDPDN